MSANDFTITGVTSDAHVLEVHDGDTMRVELLDGNAFAWSAERHCAVLINSLASSHGRIQLRLRIEGINAPELRPREGDAAARVAEKAAAVAARDYLSTLVAAAGGVVRVTLLGDGGYGRTLARVRSNSGDVAALMVGGGHAQPYDGKTKARWTPPK